MPARRRHGLSIIELLVGISTGMFVLAGATMVTANQMTDNRKLLLETQIQQDLRSAMDIIVRDVRRSGYWAGAYKSVTPDSVVQVNPYSTAGVLPLTDDVVLAYTSSRDEDAGHAETGAVESNEHNGFAFDESNHTIDVQLRSGAFEALTDPSVVKITTFTATINPTSVYLPTCSTPPCAMVSPPSPSNAACGGLAQVLTRNVVLRIEGEAVHDPSVKRSIVATVRLRNDQVCQ